MLQHKLMGNAGEVAIASRYGARAAGKPIGATGFQETSVPGSDCPLQLHKFRTGTLDCLTAVCSPNSNSDRVLSCPQNAFPNCLEVL